jgi:hypothetical protein
MKIKVPREIKVITAPYHVLYNPHLWYDEGLAGCANHRMNEIQIDPAISSSKRDVTLLHEVLEVIKDKYSIDIGHADLDRIAQGIASFLLNDLGIELDWSEIGNR